MTIEIAQRWASDFGLALAPLFENGEIERPDDHAVLLDGGVGSLALSGADTAIWRDQSTADWAWSSNLPHHVTITDQTVAVRRWDRPKAEEFSRSSVEAQLESFYTYLTTDRVRANQSVVDHVLIFFRRLRSLVADARIDDDLTVEAFVTFLDLLVSDELGDLRQGALGLNSQGAGVLADLSRPGLEALQNDIASTSALSSLHLLPALAIRHAGSQIFQEAHFELVRAPGLDLFGYVGPAESKTITRGGAHFTPAPLARSIVEQTLSEVTGLDDRETLTVIDPACGSGAFLQELLRALRRTSFKGRLTLIGRDVSRAAVSMARFALARALADWAPSAGVQLDLAVGDSLEAELPQADVVLMNPPFIAWAGLNAMQRDQMKQVLGARLTGRGDFSMAFVTRALDILTPGGAMGVLLPSSLMTLQAADAWRSDLLQRTDLRLLAGLGDYGLFAHALVQTTALVMAKPKEDAERSDVVRTLVSANSADATGNALRMLRRLAPQGNVEVSDASWRIFSMPVSTLSSRPTWRLVSPRAEAALNRLLDAGAERLGNLFEVRQGVRTGDNTAFLLSGAEVAALPSKERKYFRPAILNDSVRDGRILPNKWVFYPHGDGRHISDEATLRRNLPEYLQSYLTPRREALQNRASVQGEAWWDLSRSRASWALDARPRIVSKYFGSIGGFAVDLDGSAVVVQGFAWFPQASLAGDDEGVFASDLAEDDILCAYAAIMNSGRFMQLLELFSPHVAGGQFDLSPRYVNLIPLPNLRTLAQDERAGRLISRLAALGRQPRVADIDWQNTTNRLTAEIFGSDFFELL
ncbi:MAG: N-6 DNA methylase [Caulobacteraceae bacterium]|nr:N-6 DNA methylase [Caulobacteraceae bacterium]